MRRPELHRSSSHTAAGAGPRATRSVPRQRLDALSWVQQPLAPGPATPELMYKDLQDMLYKLHQKKWKAGVRRHAELAGVSSQSECRSKRAAETSSCEGRGTVQLAWQSFSEGDTLVTPSNVNSSKFTMSDDAAAAPAPQLLKASPAEETHCQGSQNSQGSAVPKNAGLASDVSIEDLEAQECSFADEVPRPHDSSQKDVTSEVAPDLLLDIQRVSAHLEKAGELLNGLNARVDKAATRARKSLGGG